MKMDDLNESQRKIADHLDGMIVVDAGPGTGKTKTIVERYINILEHGVDPKDVILLTFTRNAAQEMEDRIKGRMVHSKNSEKSKDVRAGTFDSFCFSVIMESPEAVSRFFGINERLTRSARTVENETLNKVYFSDFMDRFLADKGSDYGAHSIIASQHYAELYDVVNKLMSRGVTPVRDGWFGGDDGKVLYGNEREMSLRINSLNDVLDGDSHELSKYMLSNADGKYAPMDHAFDAMMPLSEEMINEAINDDRTLLIKLIHDVYYDFIRRSIIDDRLTFGLVSSFAFVVLYSDENVRDRMRCRYLMIDEFQDTNSNQFMIALMLLKEPNLCVVGDWKQGIYGFRYVSTENITRFYDKGHRLRAFLNEDKARIPFHIDECESMSLDMNYRSSQQIIDKAYDALKIPAYNGEEVTLDSVTRISAAKERLNGHTGIECVLASSYEDEIQEVLRRIQKYVSDGNYVICDDGSPPRAVRYDDIAILCRKTSLARGIFEAASSAGIPAFLQGDVDIMGSREGKLLLAWLRYINNESDPWGMCTILVDQGYPLCEIREINETGPSAIPLEIREKRRELVLKKRRVTSLISSVFDYYQLNNDITQTIISVLSSAHRNSLLTVSDMIRMIETDIESSTVYPVDSFLNRQALTIQTIHKSKGLEYPVVIVAGFNKNSFPSTKGDSSEYIFNDLTGIRSKSQVCPIDGSNFNIMASWKTRLVMRCIDKDYSEERRLLFVAVSRAKQYVTITSSNPSSFFVGLSEGMAIVNSGKEKVCLPYNEYSESMIDPPKIMEFTKRRRNIGVHDILRFEGDDAPPEGSDQVCGKGMEYGTKVHHAAELMARGIQLDSEYSRLPEIEQIRRVLDSVKDAVYLESEIECALPFNDKNITLRGIIDLYAEFSDHVEIHDYKTDTSDMFEDEYKMQLSVYAHAAAEVTGKKVSCIIDYVSQGRSISFPPLDKRCIEVRLADYP